MAFDLDYAIELLETNEPVQALGELKKHAKKRHKFYF